MVLSKAPYTVNGRTDKHAAYLSLLSITCFVTSTSLIQPCSECIISMYVANQGVYCCMLTTPYMESFGAN